jgi:hypothetical protein
MESHLASLEEAREYAWAWFALHASQRMQHFNHFLVATAFLFAGYGAALPRDDGAATLIALLGFVTAFTFRRLELRTRELVKLGESALAQVENSLSERTGLPEIRLVHAADKPEHRFLGTYRQGIAVVQWGVAVAFLGGVLLALSYSPAEDLGDGGASGSPSPVASQPAT